jgi:hypothetical protein
MDPRLTSDIQEAGRGIAMAKLMSAASSQGREAVHELFEAGGPVLVEVRHMGGVFSSDWRLCDTDDEFDHLLDDVEPEAVLHASRVWDLHNRTGATVLRR